MQITKGQLINAIDVLIEDLEINNPIYKSVIDVAQNPVIRAISAALGREPQRISLSLLRNTSSLIYEKLKKLKKNYSLN